MKLSELRTYNEKRTISQIGVVVDDIEEAVAKWTNEYHAGPWTVLTHCDEYLTDSYREPDAAEGNWKFVIALGMIGDTQIELIQPIYGIPLYQNFLRDHGEGIHHFKEIMPDDALDERLEEYKKQGIRILFGGNFYGARFYYPDTVPTLGIQVEVGNGKSANIPATYTERRCYPEK